MYLSLLGVVVVIIGFAIKLEPIAIIVVSAVVTAICGGINIVDLLTTVGTTFVANRNQLITIILMILTGTLERNGLKEAAADLIKKARGLTSGMLIAIWNIVDEICIIFKIPITGITSFVRPILMPMTRSVSVCGKLFCFVDSVHFGKYRNAGRRYADCCGTDSGRFVCDGCQRISELSGRQEDDQKVLLRS